MNVPANPGRLDFRPLSQADLPMLDDWVRRPHVCKWWGRYASHDDFLRKFLPLTEDSPYARGYVSLLDAAPMGFIQSYRAMDAGDGWWADEGDPGVHGIDQFLSAPELLGRGLGRLMINEFAHRLFADPSVTALQADPHPQNERAIRCYRAAGFHPLGMINTPDGPAQLLRRDRAMREPRMSLETTPRR